MTTVGPGEGPCEEPSPDWPGQSPGTPGRQPLLPQRTALIGSLAAPVGVGAGILTWFTSKNLAAAVLAGAAAFAAAVTFFNAVIG